MSAVHADLCMPCLLQEPWTGSAGSNETLQEPLTITLDEHNPQVLSGREVHMLSGAECSSLWRVSSPLLQG